MKYEYIVFMVSSEMDGLRIVLNEHGREGFKLFRLEIESRTRTYYSVPDKWLVVMEREINARA